VSPGPELGAKPFPVTLGDGGGAAYSVRQTADGGYIVGGEVSHAVTSSYTESAITVFTLTSSGTLVAQRDYGAGLDAYVQSLA